MSVECYPITVLPHVSQIYRDFLTMGEKPADAADSLLVRGGAVCGQVDWRGCGRMPMQRGWPMS